MFANDSPLLFKIKKHLCSYYDLNNTILKVVLNSLLLNEKQTICVKLTPNVRQMVTNIVVGNKKIDTVVFLVLTFDAKVHNGL